MFRLLHLAVCRSAGVCVAWLNFTTYCNAQSLTPDTLGTAEVTAFKQQAALASPTPMQRISTSDLRQRGITDTGDALRRMAGVNLRDYGGAGGLKTVSVRGLGASHTAVAYDGLCISDQRQGKIDLQRFNINRLQSIELHTLDAQQLLCPVRNLAAALINLQATSNNMLSKKVEMKTALKLASFGTWNPSAEMRLQTGKRTQLTLATDWFTARNNYPFTVKNGVATTRMHRNNSEMQTTTIETGLTHLSNYGTFDAKVYFYHSHRHLPGQVILYVNQNNEILTEQNAFGQMRYQYKKERWELFTATKYNWQRSKYLNIHQQYPGGALRQHYRQGEFYATAGTAYRLLPSLKAAYAADYANSYLLSNQTADNNITRNTLLQSLGLQLHTNLFKATARLTSHIYRNNRRNNTSARNETHFTPTLSASLCALNRPCKLYLRAAYKEHFRMPTFTEAYFQHLGSTDLKPELTRQFNIGITNQCAPATWWPLLTISTDAYFNKVKNRIVSVPYNLFIWRTVNLGEVKSVGVDVVAESRWKPSSRHTIIGTANYSWQRSEDRTSRNSDTYGNQLAYTPLHHGAASLAWENPWISACIHATFSSERWSTTEHMPSTCLPAYSEWGLTLYRTFCLPAVDIEVRADLLNALDQHYEVIKRYPMPGRSYSVSCQFEF